MNGSGNLEIGWIKLHRKLQECWIWLEKEPFDKRSAWVDLLLSANHSDKKILFNGELITVERGQILTSIRKLSEKWKWSVNRVYRFLKLLENDEMLQRESDNDRTLLTIVNYSVYQCTEYTNEHTNENSIGNTNGYMSDTPTDTVTEHKQEYKNNKNEKNVKNDKKERKESVAYYPNDELLNNAFKEFVTMRNKIKKPLATKQALTRMMNKIEKLSGGDNGLAIKILNQSTDHCWQDVYELKEDNLQKSGNDINASRQSQLNYLLNSIREEESRNDSC